MARRVAGGGSEDRLGTLAGDQENTMQPVKGLNELRAKGGMTWIAEEHGDGESLTGAASPATERDPYREDGGEA